MADILGFAGLFGGLTLAALLSFIARKLGLILLCAFLLRSLAALYQNYIAPLPDGNTDSVSFESYAWMLAEQGFYSAFTQFPGYGSGWGYPWLVSLVYAVSDRSALLMQSLSIIAGLLTVYFVFRLAAKIWTQEVAVKAAWLAALFPSLIMYSALTMREAFIVLALVLALYFAVCWNENNSYKALIKAFLMFAVAGFFHGAMLVGGFALAAVLLSRQLGRFYAAFLRLRLPLSGLFFFTAALLFLMMFFLGAFAIPYVGTVDRALSLDAWITFGREQSRGGASFPDWLTPEHFSAYLLLLPARFIYFLGAPFPWDIRTSAHLLGMFDGIFYLIMVFLIVKNFSAIWANRSAKVVLLLCAPLLITYAIGVGNFGTALRHRAKFAIAIIILASPLFSAPKLRKKARFRNT